MTAERNRILAVRFSGVAAAVGVGAVIACSAAAPAWAEEDGTSAAPSASSSDTPTAGHTPTSDDGPDADGPGTPAVDTPDDTSEADAAEDTEVTEDTEAAEDTDVTEDTEDTEADVDPPAVAVEPVAETPEDAGGDVTGTGTASVALPTPDDGAATDTDAAPDLPDAAPALLTLLGSARRDANETAVPAPLPATTSGAPVPDVEPGHVGGAVTTLAALPDGADSDALYTGKPSFIHDVVTFGLYVLKVVLKPFGGLLAFTSLKIPIFTDGIPPFFLTGGLDVERTEFEGMKVWTLTPRKDATDKVVVALHGGAYVATASIFHWWTYADMARETGATVVVPLQTLVPQGGTATTEVPRTANFVTKVINDHGAENVSVIGDSAGGGLALATMAELARRDARKPSRLVLVAPWLDVSMSDPRSAEINDPLLDLRNLRRAGVKWAGTGGTADPLASPLFGALQGLPPTYVYSSSLDLLTVDTLRLRDRVLAENIPDVTFRLRRGLIHDWFTFPFLPDAHEDRASVYQDLIYQDPLASVSGTGSPAKRLATK